MTHELKGCLIQYEKSLSIGCTIASGAFDGCDGKCIPISGGSVIGFDQNDIIGSAVLEEREDGVWYTATLNDTEAAEKAYNAIMKDNESIWHLGLFAYRIHRKGNLVTKGTIAGMVLAPSGDDASWIETIDGKAYHA